MGYNIKKIIDTNAKIAVLAGGPSSEREVSLRSGTNVLNALKRLGYSNTELIDIDENIAQTLRTKNIEVAYNAMHGKFGEDGCIQGMLEIMGIPYTGCGVMSSAVCMNKDFTKNILKSAGIPLIKSVLLKSDDDYLEKISCLKYPLMLKPVSEGSSIGMFKVNNEEEFCNSVKKSFEYNQDVLVEEYLEGTSLTVGVLENDKTLFATEILEFRTKTEWYDFDAKYTAGLTEFILPAQISSEMTKKVKEIAVKAFRACGCKGVSRVDFLLSDNVPYVLEVNTSPGMTDLSDLPAQSKAMGISYDELVQIILNSAELSGSAANEQ